MAKYKQYVTVKTADCHYGIVMNVENKEFDIFYNFVKKLEKSFSKAIMKNFAARFATNDWLEIPSEKMVSKIAKENKCDVIYTITAK